MRFVRLTRNGTNADIFINPEQVVSIYAVMSLGSTKIKSRLEMSSGHSYAINMRPEELMSTLLHPPTR